MDIKPSYMSHKIFDNDLVAIRKNKVTLTLNKPVYIGMCILELSKVLMYEFHYDYIKNECGNNSKLLFTDTDSLMDEIKTDVYLNEDFSTNKEMFDFNNYSTKSKYHDDSNKLVIGKMNDETAGVAIEEFVELKRKMYLYMVYDNCEHKKSKGVNIIQQKIFIFVMTCCCNNNSNIVVTTSQNEYKDVLLNKKYLRLSMNRIQSNDHKIGICEINIISLSLLDDKIYIQNNRCDGLAFRYQS